jgi:hypothetical protein
VIGNPVRGVRLPAHRAGGRGLAVRQAVLSILLALVCLVGCDQEVTITPTTTTGGASLHLGWGETATIVDGVRVAASAPVVDPEAEPVNPGDVVLYCTVQITNEGSEPFGYDQADFTLIVGDGYEGCQGGLQGRLTTTPEPALLSGTLAPGQAVWGFLPLELAAEKVSEVSYLQFAPAGPTERGQGIWIVYWSGKQGY